MDDHSRVVQLQLAPAALKPPRPLEVLGELGRGFPVAEEFDIVALGNEVNGVSEELSKMVDIHAELPMSGVKQSLNVSVAVGVVGYEFARYHIQNK